MIRDYLSFNDTSDSKKYWLQTIDAFLANDESAEVFWKEVASKDRKLSYTEMAAVLKGLNSSERSLDSRKIFHDRFFEWVLELIKHDQKINANTFFENGFPNLEDFDYLIGKTEGILKELTTENEYFQIVLRKKINMLKRRKAAHALF